MKIVDGTTHYKKQTYINESSKKDREGAGKTDSTQPDHLKEDTVSLSEGSRDIHIARKAVNDAPDVRSDKVAKLKQQISEGKYVIDPDKIAGKMISSAIDQI